MAEDTLKRIITQAAPFIQSSLDAVCIVNEKAEIVYANALMKSFLGLKPRDLVKKPVFCNLIKLAICKEKCQVKQALSSGESMRFDETPGSLKGSKLRVNLKVTPFFDSASSGLKNEKMVGAVICMRDTTAELLTQAKYTKLTYLLKEKEDQIDNYKDMLRRIRGR